MVRVLLAAPVLDAAMIQLLGSTSTVKVEVRRVEGGASSSGTVECRGWSVDGQRAGRGAAGADLGGLQTVVHVL